MIGCSFVFGANFIRVLYSRSFGTLRTSTDLNAHYFFVKPLNNIANFTLIHTGIQVILCAVNLYLFLIGDEAWSLSVLGIVINLTLFVF